MKTKTHITPGPWTVYQEGVRPGIESEFLSIVTHGVRHDDSGIYGNTKEEAEANAKLIAAAPGLLEALEEIMEMCDGNSTNENDIWHMANNAIKKATE